MDSRPGVAHRSYLFAPGSSPKVLEKALDAGADAVIFDLEDAVRPEEKARARDAVVDAIERRGGTSASPIFVRVNVLDGDNGADDLTAVCRPNLSGVVLPKAESSAQVWRAAQRIGELEAQTGMAPGSIALVPLVESAVGVLNAVEIAAAHPRVSTLTLGGVDLLADLGATGGSHGPATLHARAQLVLACRAAGLAPPIDTVHTALDDDPGLTAAADEARSLGYFGKLVLHPRQLPVVHRAFTPSTADVEMARRIVHAFETASRDGRVAVAIHGEFVDLPVVRRARQTLDLAERLDRFPNRVTSSEVITDARRNADQVGTLRGFVIDVDDLGRAEAFWSSVTGLPVSWSARGPFSLLGDGRGPGRLLLQLVEDLTPRGNRVHLDVTVPDVDAAVEHISNMGGRLLRGNRHKRVGKNAIRWAVVADPFGNVFCVVQDLTE